jgi:cytochrome c peroxidase
MTRVTAWLLSSLVFVLPAAGIAADPNLDQALARVVDGRNLEPLEAPALVPSPKFRLGQMLFFDPILSGNRDIACATCHLLGRGTSDAVPLSVGTRAEGLAEERRFLDRVKEHPRNSIDIWNRGHETVRNMFWDGRIATVDGPVTKFRSPMGTYLPGGMENVLAIQALFPLAGEEEMLGFSGDRSRPDLPAAHADRPNELAEAARGLDGPQRIVAIHDALMRRLLGTVGTTLTDWQIAYRRLIDAAYPETLLSAITIGDLANAIGHFEALAFATRDTPWDRYLAGDAGAITDEAKRGALLFYGKARCVACHTGPLFSDFRFYSLAVPRIGPGIDESGDDRGRFEATRIPNDLYRFRTPPLRNVTLTAPYFHNGAVATLRAAIAWHFGPDDTPSVIGDEDIRPDPAIEAARLASFTPILAHRPALTELDITDLIAFLGSLEDQQLHRRSEIIPQSVPSGLSVPALPSTH